MFQVKFAGGNNFKKFLSNRQTKISDTLKERRFHLDLGGRAPFEWQWTYIWIPPRKLKRTPMFFFFFTNIPPFERRKRLSSSLRGSHERLVITRYSRRNWSELLIFFLFLRRDYRHLQLNWSIHQATRTRAFYLIFIADQFSTIRFRCEKDVRTKRGDASNGWKMGKEGEEYRRRQEEIDNEGEVEGKDEDGDRST